MKTTKNLLMGLICVILFSISLGYSLVFAGGINGKIEFKTTENIFLDYPSLNKSKIYISASDNISDITIYGDCDPVGLFVDKINNLYIFDIMFTDPFCNQSKANVYFNKGTFNLETSYNLFSSYYLYSEYLDYSDEKLNEYLNGANSIETKLINDITDKELSLEKKLSYERKLKEVQYMKSFVDDILFKREDKYIIPIKGLNMTTKSSKLPNSGRPYRANYTNGVHEGWDFDGNFGTAVTSIDYGIVVRVVNNFTYSDLGKIKENGDLVEIDKMWNLDILRGNQVWIKTMKGDLVFYAHLNEVFTDIKEGNIVFKGQPLGTIGISGIPDKNYKDYHLHLELRKNPYLEKKQAYTIEDYMSWDWYFKGESEKYILENQYSIFQKNEG